MSKAKVAPLLWTDDLNTGIPLVDEQHRILVNTLNEANAELRDDSSLELFEQITRDLLSYALYHFETEEELMKGFGYDLESTPDYDKHLHEHRAFTAKVVAIREDLKQGLRIPRDDLLSFLNNWLVNHIMKTDKHLGRFVVAKDR